MSSVAGPAGRAARGPRVRSPQTPTAAEPGWGYLPGLSLLAAVGVLVLAIAYTLARGESALAEPLYWSGLVIIGAPITVRLASAGPELRERLGLVVVLGMALYFAAVLQSPDSFTGYDELQHLRTLSDILEMGHLFTPNTLLDVSPFFPGLEIITAAVAQVSGADPFSAAIVVLGFVRVLFGVALFALYREASGSSRLAGLAAAIYMLNPNFTFFDSQFAYESLALPLLVALMAIVAARARSARQEPLLSVSLAVVAATLVVTHHVTSYEAGVIVVAWLFINLLRRRRDAYRTGGVALAAGLLTIGAAAWLLNVAVLTIDYLGPPVTGAIQQVIRLITEGQGRTLFESSTGELAPLWERLSALGMAGLLTLAIPVGLVPLVRYLRDNSLAMLLGVIALGYPASLLGRLTPSGGEAAGRSVAVIFIGLAFLVSLAVLSILELPEVDEVPRRWLRASIAFLRTAAMRLVVRAGLAASLIVVLLGGIVAGTSPATRLPGAYLVGADSRSIDAQSVQTALWAREVLGNDRRFAGDRVNRLLLGSYGRQHVVFFGSDRVEEWQVFLSPTVGDAEIARLRRGEVRFIVIDRRLSTGLPLVPYYYEVGEIYEGGHTEPISADVLGKWDDVPGVDRIYDSGFVQIYDVGGVDGTR